MIKGRSLELFFVDGRPEGMLTAEVFNWTGHVLRIPRTVLAEGLKRREAGQTGVYILLGADELGELAYIGETEDMAKRLSQHARDKEWWNQAVLVTTAGDALHKAHVKFLESKLVEAAQSAGAIRLENGNQPQGAGLNEAATANMESFLETLFMVLPAIKVDFFQSGKRELTTKKTVKDEESSTTHFQMTLPKSNLKANAILIGDELIVQKGSSVRAEWVGDRKHNKQYWKLHEELVRQGIIEAGQEQATFTSDFAFSSPSAAAAIITGRSANGRKEWKTLQGKTYDEWEKDRLSKV